MEHEKQILVEIKALGGKLYRVGGCVRDSFLGLTPKDIDYLVTGIELQEIYDIVSKFGKANEVGKSFGIVTVTIDGESYDFALPRTEHSTGDGHKDFQVKTDKSLSVEEDIMRRDASFNAIAMDIETGEFIDPFDGISDLHRKLIRAVRDPFERFEEDPLRILRFVQFASRFGFAIEDKTFEAMKMKADTVLTCASERIHAEFMKAFEKSDSTETLCDILMESGLDRILFGDDFDPMCLSLKDLPSEFKSEVAFLAMFARGGDLKHFSPTLHQLELLKVYRGFSEDAIPFKYLKDRKYLEILFQLFRIIKPSKTLEISRLMKLPLFPKDLPIDGTELMSMGLAGPAIGKAQKEMLTLIFQGKMDSTREDVLHFLSK
jgi:tRNA nucleotidyltransferase/poly(A) polymerase